MFQLIQLILNPMLTKPVTGFGIILQQNTSVLLLQDIYTGSWGFSSQLSEIPIQENTRLTIFAAISQLQEDTGYSSPDDFVLTGPPCKYGTNYYWYATLNTLNPPILKNKFNYQNIKFISREDIPSKVYSPTYDVEMWIKKGMRYSCLNRNILYR